MLELDIVQFESVGQGNDTVVEAVLVRGIFVAAFLLWHLLLRGDIRVLLERLSVLHQRI